MDTRAVIGKSCMLGGNAILMSLLVTLASLICCAPEQQPALDNDAATKAANLAIQKFTSWVEPMWPDPSLYEIEDIYDLDGDGSYEVSFRQRVDGNMGWISGLVFRLEGDSLVLFPQLAFLQRSGGETRFYRDAVVVSYRAWESMDAHCCPSLTVRDSLSLSADGVLTPRSSDTIRVR